MILKYVWDKESGVQDKYSFPTGIYLLKVNNRNTRIRCKYVHLSGVFIVNFEHISYLVLVFLLLNLNM